MTLDIELRKRVRFLEEENRLLRENLKDSDTAVRALRAINRSIKTELKLAERAIPKKESEVKSEIDKCPNRCGFDSISGSDYVKYQKEEEG